MERELQDIDYAVEKAELKLKKIIGKHGAEAKRALDALRTSTAPHRSPAMWSSNKDKRHAVDPGVLDRASAFSRRGAPFRTP